MRLMALFFVLLALAMVGLALSRLFAGDFLLAAYVGFWAVLCVIAARLTVVADKVLR